MSSRAFTCCVDANNVVLVHFALPIIARIYMEILYNILHCDALPWCTVHCL